MFSPCSRHFSPPPPPPTNFTQQPDGQTTEKLLLLNFFLCNQNFRLTNEYTIEFNDKCIVRTERKGKTKYGLGACLKDLKVVWKHRAVSFSKSIIDRFFLN